MTVENDGTVVIKAPKLVAGKKIDRFYCQNQQWITERRKALEENRIRITFLTARDIKALKEKATLIMTARTDHYSRLMGVRPEAVKITSAAKRWGSCTYRGGKHTICYSYRCALLSPDCQDYIVVHELAHIKHMNHSAEFYAFIEKFLPDYRERIKETKQFTDFHIYENHR